MASGLADPGNYALRNREPKHLTGKYPGIVNSFYFGLPGCFGAVSIVRSNCDARMSELHFGARWASLTGRSITREILS